MIAAAAALTLALSTVVATDDDHARFGPPWISVEYPANPHHGSTRDATFLVHAYHHSTSIQVAMSARAEGLVKGQRVSRSIDVAETNLPGVYAVRAPKLEAGTWIVAVTLDQGESSTATVLVNLGNDGEVMMAHVPSTRTPDGWVVPTEVTDSYIDAALHSAALAGPASDSNGTHRAGVAGLVLLALGGLATGAMRSGAPRAARRGREADPAR